MTTRVRGPPDRIAGAVIFSSRAYRFGDAFGAKKPGMFGSFQTCQ